MHYKLGIKALYEYFRNVFMFYGYWILTAILINSGVCDLHFLLYMSEDSSVMVVDDCYELLLSLLLLLP